MRTVFLALALLIVCTLPAHAISPDNTYTHHTALTVPELTTSTDKTTTKADVSYQLAATWFLPDWQAGMGSRTDTAPAGSGDIPVECKNYSPECTSPLILGGKTVHIGNQLCAVDCVCPDSYTTTSCGSEYTVRGTPCRYNGKDYYQGCDPKPCSAGGYSDSGSQTGKICTPVTYGGRSCYSCKDDPCYNLTDHSGDTDCKNYGCQSKYSACSSKCQACYSDNCRNRTAVSTPYGCEKYFADCSSKCEKAYGDNCRNRQDNTTDYGCEKKWEDCQSKCEVGKTCVKNDCSSFTLTSIPANANYSSCTPGCGVTTTTYKLTSCKSGYKLYNGSCLVQTALPILYADKTVADVIISGKTAIGVVFDEANSRAVALSQGQGVFQTDETIFSGYNPNTIPCEVDAVGCNTNEGFINTYGTCTGYGKYNYDSKMKAAYPAFSYACSYAPAGITAQSWFKTGRWYIPSMEELKKIYNIRTSIDSTLKSVGGTAFSSAKYWSSTGNILNIYRLNFSDGTSIGYSSESSFSRPVINYNLDENLAYCIENKYQYPVYSDYQFGCTNGYQEVICPKNSDFFKCESPNCEAQGKKTCNGSCIAKTACCTNSDCSSGYKCSSNSCVKMSCSEQGLKDCNGSCIAQTACCNCDTSNGYRCQNGSCVDIAYARCRDCGKAFSDCWDLQQLETHPGGIFYCDVCHGLVIPPNDCMPY